MGNSYLKSGNPFFEIRDLPCIVNKCLVECEIASPFKTPFPDFKKTVPLLQITVPQFQMSGDEDVLRDLSHISGYFPRLRRFFIPAEDR